MSQNPNVAGLDPQDLANEMERFGVAEDQVVRDHAISHVLAAISRGELAGRLTFFGGTALSRTHLVSARLSEDIDLIANESRWKACELIEQSIEAALLGTHGRVTWNPPFTKASDVTPANMEIAGRIVVRLQVLDSDRYPSWPVEVREIEQRYRDAPPAILQVPTIDSFAGSKTAAWLDRAAPRDLYDLWALAEQGSLTSEAAELFARCGPTGRPPRSFMFRKAPTAQAWESQLAGQTRLRVTADKALEVVRSAWEAAVGSEWK